VIVDVVIADDQYAVRHAIKLLLECEADLRLVSEVTNDTELLARLAISCPDLVLLDWELPSLDGSDLLALIRVVCPGLKMVVLSSHPEAREKAMQAGAHCFVSKGEPAEHLLTAVREVMDCILALAS
jgi:DNA-binding NarL/FixJ family response regulator